MSILPRVTGAVLLILAGAGGGFSFCSHQTACWRQLHTFARLLSYLQGALSYQALTGDELLQRAAYYPEFAQLGLTKCRTLEELPFPGALSESLKQEIRSGLQETSAILGSTATTMQERDREYQATLQRQEEQRAQASAPTPAPAPRATTPKTRKPRTQKAATPAPRTTPEVQRKSNEFKAAQRDLDSARQDVDKRINSYENSVAALLG